MAIRRPRANGVAAPRKFDRNVIVIGAGSAGLTAAYLAAKAGAKVTLIEAHKMGGDCLNTGCVPSKALIKSARAAAAAREASRYGLKDAEPAIDFAEVMARVRGVIDAIRPHDSEETFEGYGVDVVRGYARFVDPWTVEIKLNHGGFSRLTARHFVVATGSEPIVPSIDGVEDSAYLTSETLWDAMSERQTIPERFVIIGGGPIGCELAQSFQRLGSQVTVVEQSERLLGKEDGEAANLVRERMEAEGVTVLASHEALRFERDGQSRLVAKGPDGDVTLIYDALLIGIGRKARLSGYGLEAIGVDTEKTIAVDGKLQSALPHIYAAGDVAGPFQFTHAAGFQGMKAGYSALFAPFYTPSAAEPVMPRATYTEPEVASVGLNEASAKEQGIAYELTRFEMSELERAVAESETEGFIKVLTKPGGDRILGAVVVAANAAEILTSFTIAMNQNMGLAKLMAVIFPYPSWAEAAKLAAQEHALAHVSERLIGVARRYLKWQRGS
ncbi:dihydrolipoyl dehydrogenase family protein [Novosphingopyxis sp.]|uniref:dihydrolipoyl dehydrogenase family protein n=1 Tax=Novosphingopyxis sp. TaxID=2709690 RepID=UPI003B5999A0